MPEAATQQTSRTDDASAAHLEAGKLSRGQLTLLAIASYSPAVFMAAGPMLFFNAAGPTAWLSVLFAALGMACVGRAIITFARRVTGTGSLYTYVGEVFKPWAQHITAASLFIGFVMQAALIAALIGLFMGSFLTSLGMESALTLGPQLVIWLIAIVVPGLVAYRGLDISVRVALLLAAVSLPLIVVISVTSAFHTGLDLSAQFDASALSVTGTLQGVAGGAAFLIAFESCSSLAAETRDPKRSVPVAVMTVPVVLGALLVVSTILQVPGLTGVQDDLGTAMSPSSALALEAGLGAAVSTTTDLVLGVATFAAQIAFLNYGSRFLQTIGAERLLPTKIAAIHPRYHTPNVSVVALCAISFLTLLSFVLVFDDVLTAYYLTVNVVLYAWIVPYLLITAGAVVLTIRERSFRPGLVLASSLGGAAIGWVLVNAVANPPVPQLSHAAWGTLVTIGLLSVAFSLHSRLLSAGGRSQVSSYEPVPEVSVSSPQP